MMDIRQKKNATDDIWKDAEDGNLLRFLRE